MRWGAFMLGGLVGAAAVVYLSRNRNSMMFSSVTGETFGKAMNQAKNKFMDLNLGNREKTQKSAAGNGLSEVKNIVEKDPELNKQVQDIFADNDQSKLTTQ